MIIDTERLGDFSIQQVALLLLLYDKTFDKSTTLLQVKDTDIRSIFRDLERQRLILSNVYAIDYDTNPPTEHLSWSILERGKQALAEISTPTKKSRIRRKASEELENRCDALAKELSELYPAGIKPGTSQKWRGYSKLVSEKLQKLILDGNDFTDEEAIAATKAYIASFNGKYTTMRILPYFLSKNEVIGGEVKKSRDFMSYIEDARNNQQSHFSQDWDVTLR